MNLRVAAVAAAIASSLATVPTIAQEKDCGAAPVAVVARFLRLGPEQAQAFGQLLQSRQAALAPILQQIAQREQRIRELVAAGGNPAEIGTLMLQVHQLQQAAAAAQAQFLTAFAGLLDEEQRRQWDAVRLAAQLQPVLPAFQALQML
jgi:HPt (histidine-containing phosphotransfer) domain-containing protein